MAEIIIMPKLGFNMNEGKLVKWYKREGDNVVKGENLFSVETDKTNMDIAATDDGTVRKLFIDEGDTLSVTLPIAIVGGENEDISDLLVQAEEKLRGTKVQAAANSSNKKSVADSNDGIGGSSQQQSMPGSTSERNGMIFISPRAKKAAEERGINIQESDIAGTGFGGGICEKDIVEYASMHKDRITPVARAISEAEGINISGLAGSGANGKIMKKDVCNVMRNDENRSGAAEQYSPDGKAILEEAAYDGVRRVIGEHMAESKFTAPHLYFTQEIDMSELLKLRKQINAVQEKKTSVTDYIARATILALEKYPDMNSSLVGEKIVKYKSINLGIAVASNSGLIVPNVKDAQKLSLIELAEAYSPLFEKAREGKLAPDEYSGGTFTLSNLGMFGIINFTAIINPPESAILSVSATKDRAVVVEHEDGEKSVEIRPLINMTVSVDHRVIDGLMAAQFMMEIKNLLEKPLSLVI